MSWTESAKWTESSECIPPDIFLDIYCFMWWDDWSRNKSAGSESDVVLWHWRNEHNFNYWLQSFRQNRNLSQWLVNLGRNITVNDGTVFTFDSDTRREENLLRKYPERSEASLRKESVRIFGKSHFDLNSCWRIKNNCRTSMEGCQLHWYKSVRFEIWEMVMVNEGSDHTIQIAVWSECSELLVQ